MKRYAFILVSAFAVITLVSSASAQTDPQQTTNDTPTTTTTPTEEAKKRVEERKARIKPQLNTAAKQRLASRCKGAQGKLQGFTTKVTESNKQALERYGAYITKVETLEKTLADNGTKSTELLSQIAETKVKYEAYKQAVESAKQSASDAGAIDCAKDPEGFKAALEDARTQATKIRETRIELKQYIQKTLRATLQSLKDKEATQNAE
jgi:hypothetical protein